MSEDDKADGCGTFVGNGDKPGPLWIVDATDFSKLGPANDKKSPEQALRDRRRAEARPRRTRSSRRGRTRPAAPAAR